MDRNSRTNLARANAKKLALVVVIFLGIIFVGSILFSLGIAFRKRTLFLRIVYMVSAGLLVSMTIRSIAIKVNFPLLWSRFYDNLFDHKEDYEKRLMNRYTELSFKYPLSVARFESHYWRDNPRATNFEIMERALETKEQEWEEQERSMKNK